MVYLKKGSKTYKVRVSLPGGAFAELSTGCRNESDATRVELAVRRWEGKHEKRHAREQLVEALVRGRVSLVDAYEASLAGTLDRLVAEAPEEPLRAPMRSITDSVDEWIAWQRKQKKGAKSADTYLRQMKTLFPEIDTKGLFLAHFTKVHVTARLDALEVDGPTKNRYRLAVSGFAKFLVRRGILETNFVRDIPGFGENDAREVYYERAEAQRLIAALHQPVAAVAAFACGFCMEWGAITELLARDVLLVDGEERVYVRGTKTKKRLRWVRLVDENRWVLPFIRPALTGKSPDARLFPDLPKWVALKDQQKVARDLKIVAVGEDRFTQHTLHDWRHTHTVQLLRDGYDEAVAALHLGHANTDLVRTTYGVYIVGDADYLRRRVTTSPTTTPELTLHRDAK